MYEDHLDGIAHDLSHRCDASDMTGEVEYHVAAALRCVGRAFDISTECDEEVQPEALTELFRVVDHLNMGVLEAVRRTSDLSARPTA
jgi:hypothetical protein